MKNISLPENLDFFPPDNDPATIAAVFDRLVACSLDFWSRPEVADLEFGGQHPWFDRNGNKISPPPELNYKNIINLLRMMYVQSLKLKAEPENREVAALLERGFRYLEKYRTPHGFLNWLKWDGSPVSPNEHPITWITFEADSISSIYMLYIASEIYLNLGDPRYLALADESFNYLEKYALDPLHGGYFNTMDPATRVDFTKDTGQNMHMALALSRYYRCSPTPLLAKRMNSLVKLLKNTLNDHDLGWNSLTQDWQTPVFHPHPKFKDDGKNVLSGHNAELVWYLEDVCQAIDLPYPDELLRLAAALRKLVEPNGLFHCWVRADGSFHPVKRLIWWSQFEIMIMLLRVHLRTGDPGCLTDFNHVASLTMKTLLNPENGVFYGDCDLTTGEHAPQGGWAWKGGLHVVRGLSEASKLLKKIAADI